MSESEIEVEYLKETKKLKKPSTYQEFLQLIEEIFFIKHDDMDKITISYIDDEEEEIPLDEENFKESISSVNKFLLNLQEDPISKGSKEEILKLQSEIESIKNDFKDFQSSLNKEKTKKLEKKIQEIDKKNDEELKKLDEEYKKKYDEITMNFNNEIEKLSNDIKEKSQEKMLDKIDEYEKNLQKKIEEIDESMKNKIETRLKDIKYDELIEKQSIINKTISESESELNQSLNKIKI